jgi:hypothetical protein
MGLTVLSDCPILPQKANEAKMRKLAWLLAAFVTLGFPAYAEDAPPELPPIDGPDQWHVLTHDDATSTSKCIGDPKTPLCAVETVLACFLRHKDELCRIGSGDPNFPSIFQTEIQPAESWRYWVAGVELVSENNRGSFKRVRYLKPQLGDIAVRISDAPCYDNKCYKPVGPPTIYLVRRNGDKWMAADKAVPRW